LHWTDSEFDRTYFLFKMKAFRHSGKFYESHGLTKGLVIKYGRKLEQNFFATISQEKKAFLLSSSFIITPEGSKWSCATERRKLHGERNNARYYFWSKKKRKTKNTLAG